MMIHNVNKHGNKMGVTLTMLCSKSNNCTHSCTNICCKAWHKILIYNIFIEISTKSITKQGNSRRDG